MASRKKKFTKKFSKERLERLHSETDSKDSKRTPAQRDRDRVLYSAYFRRLAVITQVVSPQEGFWVHNRLTHVLKVAQVGRRLAERLVGKDNGDLIIELGGLDPDVVETACLAHDLGHPPFGHVTEKLLDELARESKPKVADGFEGNAQSFRVVAELEQKSGSYKGLNLTRASLNAILKYPWHRATDGGKSSEKWGAYHSEKAVFDFARTSCEHGVKSLEADLMDWADDIAYSVHDMEDFYLMGKIPLHKLAEEDDERLLFLESALKRLKVLGTEEEQSYRETARSFFDGIPVEDVFSGDPLDLAGIHNFSSLQINRLICATSLTESGLKVPDEERRFVGLLKQLTWHYVIEDESLATQQEGQKHIVKTLFETFQDAPAKLFPPEFRHRALEAGPATKERIRLVLDMICSFTEQQCIMLFHRLTGVALGALLHNRA